MRIPDQSRRTPTGANMTPMIDVVFLLIIFFLVSSHLAKRETRLPVDLPIAGKQLPPASASEDRITIHVDSSRVITIGGSAVAPGQLRRILRAHVDQRGDTAAIHIRTDRSVEYAVAGPLLREAALAGVAKITFAVLEEKR